MVTVVELLRIPFKVRVFRKLELAARVSEVKLSAKLAAEIKLWTDAAVFDSVTVVPADGVSMQASSLAPGTALTFPGIVIQFPAVFHRRSPAFPVHRIVVPVGQTLAFVTVMFAKADVFVLGLVSFSETVAVLTKEPAVVAVATMDAVAEAPTATFPRLQLMVVVPMQVPWLAVAETKVIPAGSGSVKMTPVEDAGPLLVTVIVKVTVVPWVTVLGVAVLVMERLATRAWPGLTMMADGVKPTWNLVINAVGLLVRSCATSMTATESS
jgi:hypothetical protein